jgi:hypothetical protein
MPEQPKYHPRARMEKAIKDGGGVMFHPTGPGGMTETRVITRVEDLPSEAELAGDDETKRAAARAELVARRQAIEAELAKLEAAPKAKAAPPPDAAPDEEEAAEEFSHLSADELKALCDEHGCEVEGRRTKKAMAEALAAKGVPPPAKE